ncbi:MAG: dihydrodipicolinate synthetase [Acidimicrobiaceae bacterium]|nr:dihydrodipicolinate synthetase [Acidimicrobiaceae bacterium]
MPTPAVVDAENPSLADTIDHLETRRAVEALVQDGVNAILTNGTFGEGASLLFEEVRTFAETVVAASDDRVPIFVGATSLNTRESIARARVLSDVGVAGILLGRPMWSPCDDDDLVRYYNAVADAVPDLSIIAYDNPEAFKGKISPIAYSRLAEIPQVVAAKYTGLSGGFLADLEAVNGKMRLLPVERDWYYAWKWAPEDVVACWSGSASCGPNAIIQLSRKIKDGDDLGAKTISRELASASRTFFPKGSFALFSQYNIQLEKIRINEAGYMKAGPCRPPYISCPNDYAEGARQSGRLLADLHRRYASQLPND